MSSIQVFGFNYGDRRCIFSTLSIYFKNIGDVWNQTSGFLNSRLVTVKVTRTVETDNLKDCYKLETYLILIPRVQKENHW